MKPSVAKWIRDEVIQRVKKCFLTAQDNQKHTCQNRIDTPDVRVDSFDMLDIWTQKWTWQMKVKLNKKNVSGPHSKTKSKPKPLYSMHIAYIGRCRK